ncbi:hypothetical protein [Brevibacillus laterosporus]|uniref:hypothetical protein n=1 Tax=Brevibacillus laterosporus TaxID=1465 RepID=UPI002E244EDA|nr:hypothetical protein [Brevibacillus laterosporus]MED1667294.1 hypothetical protein [Brevibacillus laterosporus]MED1718245.1 hypothetical protein [Brevibacillus laterosporus]
MIVNKSAEKFMGYIEYSYRPDPNVCFTYGFTEEDEEMPFESDTFYSLEELLNKVSQTRLEEFKKEYDADKVWISCISFKAKSEDEETAADISLFDRRKSMGVISTKISNKDITNRALTNIKKLKEIIDNTLEQYSIKY